ncbi:alpha/beta fold hydrolase [Bradyrhizobium sp. Leo121]|uniref:alpha/beta hydrolase family protein n=1 Tax=Bradyrhizobium sp. Leo121 TaxID=1571195 RepID=UPI001FDFFC6A|nr:alpha/beta fold hydrolase [Bradyrhizobium sp. Leo121]
MTKVALRISMEDGTPVTIPCRDGVTIGGHLWLAPAGRSAGSIIVNAATGVAARYYHRYACFLANHGFDVLTYDYRGIGGSRPSRLRGCGYRWRDWGELDFEAALCFMHERRPQARLIVVGHSVGGFLAGLAASAGLIERMLTVGAQYAWWGDYAPRRRAGLFLKWHIAMPVMTALCGYFPGRRLGWLEDLPAGVANEWSFRGRRFERSHPRGERQAVLSRMAAVTGPILAIAVSDDELGTVPAIRRTLGYYTGAPRTAVLLEPSDYGRKAIGHFNLFHDSHAVGFWTDTLPWLRDGRNPWPGHVLASVSPGGP